MYERKMQEDRCVEELVGFLVDGDSLQDGVVNVIGHLDYGQVCTLYIEVGHGESVMIENMFGKENNIQLLYGKNDMIQCIVIIIHLILFNY